MVCSAMYTSGSVSSLALTFGNGAGGRWAGYHYCGGWAYQYGYAPHSCYIFGGG